MVMTVLNAPRNSMWLLAMIYLVPTSPMQAFSVLIRLPNKQQQHYLCMMSPLNSVVPTSSDTETQLKVAEPSYNDISQLSYTQKRTDTDGELFSKTTRPIRVFDTGTTTMQQQIRYVVDALCLVLLSLLFSIVLISWEDLTCRSVLPSRHRTSISLYQPSSSSLTWGMMTIHGMGFSQTDRQGLINAASESQTFEIDPLLSIPTYNEVMLRHRTITIPQWKQHPTSYTISTAIHTVIESMKQLDVLRDMANDYQWETLRSRLHDLPISDLSDQSSILRQVSTEMNEVVGFDWGSCAWRHCGAISDIQEAIDEVDQLLGVLEPHEVIFCLDIMERSLRDILAVVPWQQYALENDILFFSKLPPYVSSISNSNADTDEDTTTNLSRIDSEYLKALQELRVD